MNCLIGVLVGLLLISVHAETSKAFPTFQEYVKALNYPVETHDITTEDGYILTYFRIQAKGQTSFKKGLPVVLFYHGLLDSADTWVVNDEKDAPGLVVANRGYDVWFANARGTKYCESHVSLNSSDPVFWQFTFQNMSEYDLPAAFEYIHSQTNQMISYVGHSQGTAIMFAALSQRDPTILSYLNKYIALAPIAWVNHIKSGPMELMAHSQLAAMMEALHINQFFPANFLESDFGHYFCATFPQKCGNFMGFLVGYSKEYDNVARYNIIVEHEPGGTSVTNMLHWKQLVLNNRFGKYDYGTAGNMLHYNQITPPDYNVSNINVPMHLFMGYDDSLLDEVDTQNLLDHLTGCKYTYKEYPADHMTWIWSKNISFYADDFFTALEGVDPFVL